MGLTRSASTPWILSATAYRISWKEMMAIWKFDLSEAMRKRMMMMRRRSMRRRGGRGRKKKRVRVSRYMPAVRLRQD